MARMSFIVAATAIALAIVFHFAAASSDRPVWPSTNVTIQNNFPTYNLTIQCDSDIPEGHLDAHLVLPKDVYMFHIYTIFPHRWTCTMSTEKVGNDLCRKVYSAKFIVYEGHMPITPRRPLMCDGLCPWFVDADGLSLIRHPGGKPVHMYDWPAQNSNRNC